MDCRLKPGNDEVPLIQSHSSGWMCTMMPS